MLIVSGELLERERRCFRRLLRPGGRLEEHALSRDMSVHKEPEERELSSDDRCNREAKGWFSCRVRRWHRWTSGRYIARYLSEDVEWARMILEILQDKITFVLKRRSLRLKMLIEGDNLRFEATYVLLD